LSGKLGKISVDRETIKGAIATCWKELGIDQDIGAIKARANDIQNATQSLENLFKVTRGRGEYGEFQLEQILKDSLPTQYLHIRKRIPKIGKMTNEEKNDRLSSRKTKRYNSCNWGYSDRGRNEESNESSLLVTLKRTGIGSENTGELAYA